MASVKVAVRVRPLNKRQVPYRTLQSIIINMRQEIKELCLKLNLFIVMLDQYCISNERITKDHRRFASA